MICETRNKIIDGIFRTSNFLSNILIKRQFLGSLKVLSQLTRAKVRLMFVSYSSDTFEITAMLVF